MLKYVRELKFEATPNYSALHKLIGEMAAKGRFVLDNIFDWDTNPKMQAKLRKSSRKLEV